MNLLKPLAVGMDRWMEFVYSGAVWYQKQKYTNNNKEVVVWI